jgi:signal transduction histidine kinase
MSLSITIKDMATLLSRVKKTTLPDRINHIQLFISTSTIVIVEILFMLIFSIFTVRNLDKSANSMANDAANLLMIPMYNLDYIQSTRIIETLLSSGNVSGIILTSTENGIIIDRKPSALSRWVSPQRRNISYQGFDLGILEIYSSDRMLVDMVYRILISMVVVIAGVIIINYIVTRMLLQRRLAGIFDELTAGINEIGKGRYGLIIRDTGFVDLDQIINVINGMSEHIRSKSVELQDANATLEERVATRTQELETALCRQQELQNRLIKTEKLSALGQLSAGIAHELNTPLGAIQSSVRTLTFFIDNSLSILPAFLKTLNDREYALYNAIFEQGLKENSYLTGQLSTSHTTRKIANELDAAGVRDYENIAELIADIGLGDKTKEMIPFMHTERDIDIIKRASEAVMARRMTEVINESSRKAAVVISALRLYLSPDSEDDMGTVDIPSNITNVLALMHNMLKHGITLTTDLQSAVVRGSADRLSQVWINIIRNAAQAMEYKGTLHISVMTEADAVKIHFVDSGPGIPGNIQNRIFEPFFTTKKQSDGMGLGLDICKKIVESHHGTIGFVSMPGRTDFTVMLPSCTAITRGYNES